MKKSSLVLLVLMCLFIVSLFGADFLLKNQYEKIDKTDPFWNFTKLKNGRFHHLKISGGNVTRMVFSPAPHASVGVLSQWENGMLGRVETAIDNDTLYLQVKPGYESPGIRDWMRDHILISISCPDLLSVNAINTNLEVNKLKQKNLKMQIAGKSRVEIESYISDFDSISVHQQDSSVVIFEMADEIKSSGTMQLNSLFADIQGHSLLDVGHFQIRSIQESISDTAGILLSGSSLRRLKQ